MMRKRRSRGFRPLGEHLDERCLLSGFTPAQIADAYGLNAISFPSASGTKVAGDGSGQTIAIVDLYHDPNLQASLNAFDAQYSLPNLTLNVIDQAGNQTDDGWAQEETLDVEWAHAIAPRASIMVVEAAPGSDGQQELNNVLAAVRTASQTTGVSVVSMSWGYDEFQGEDSYDSTFTTPGITYIASSGDSGTVEWPATSPNVLSVGGTSLQLAASGGYGSETGWSDSGGGLSTIMTEPAYQKSFQSTGDRTTPDLSFDGDPDTGVAIYVIPPESTDGQGQWQVVGGTSVGAPAWAGILAIVNQGRALAGLSSLTGATQTLPTLYGLPAADFNKVPESSGGGSNAAISTANYNTQAGLGSPVGPALIGALVGNTTITTPTPTPSPSPSPVVPPGLLTPKPIRFPTPKPTPLPVQTPAPSPAPLPTPTPAPTPPPAAPPSAPPAATASPVSKPKHHARQAKTKPAHRPIISHPRSIRQSTHHGTARPGPSGQV
jgi:subtilase family serine protease